MAVETQIKVPVVPEGCPLYSREFQYLEMIYEGAEVKDIIAATGRCKSVINTALRKACRRLGVRTVMHAVLACYKAGWFDEPAESYTPFANSVKLSARQLVLNHTIALHLQSTTSEERDATSRIIDRALIALYEEKGLTPQPLRTRRELADKLIQRYCGQHQLD
jgi:hypothetical protein